MSSSFNVNCSFRTYYDINLNGCISCKDPNCKICNQNQCFECDEPFLVEDDSCV